MQFLSALNVTEFYVNLNVEMLSGKRQPKFDKILDLIPDINFTMLSSIMFDIANV